MRILSTGHLPPADVDLVSDLSDTRIYSNPIGFFVHTSFAQSGRCPTALLRILLEVEEDYVCFDCDGPLTDQFPSYMDQWS